MRVEEKRLTKVKEETATEDAKLKKVFSKIFFLLQGPALFLIFFKLNETGRCKGVFQDPCFHRTV